jgi:LysM repeat protein
MPSTPRALFAAAVAAWVSCAGPAFAKGEPLRALRATTRVEPAGAPAEHTVYPGQTLGKIAKRYNVSIESICRFNKIKYGARIKPGQRLLIPAEGEDVPATRTGNRWQDFVEPPLKRGVVVLETPNRRFKGAVLGKGGKVLPRAREGIERVLASWRTGRRHEIDTRLIQLIVKMSDTFGGRPIRVVSGYREHSFADESKHKVGRAFDFSIPGIPNAMLRDYLRTQHDVGVGYYPNSTHVHLDVRDVNTYWVDSSSPGDPPRYAGKKRPAPAHQEDGAGEVEEGAGEATETTEEAPVREDAPPARNDRADAPSPPPMRDDS